MSYAQPSMSPHAQPSMMSPTAAYDHFYGAVGAAPETGKTSKSARRQRLNIVAVCEMIFLPWIMFSSVLALMSFQIHHQHPHITFMACILFLLVVLCVGWEALRTYRKKQMGFPVEPTWLSFLFFSLLFAWCLAMISGELNFHINGGIFYDLASMNSYGSVNPAQMNGAQLMDAGKVFFKPGTKIDVQKSMGFRNQVEYCVAPIVFGNDPLSTYDFWAVGTNCCSGLAPDYHCGDYSSPKALAGLRLMDDRQRPFFRLAVEQAEANYKIKANHPLFFHWMEDPQSAALELQGQSSQVFVFGMSAYFIFNLFCVMVTTIVYSKFG